MQDVYVVGTSMGAAVIWSYIENYRTSRLAGAIFVDQAPLQVLSSQSRCHDVLHTSFNEYTYIHLHLKHGSFPVHLLVLQYTASDWKLGSKGCYDPASLAVLQHSLKADFKGFAAGNGECCLSQPQPASVLDALAEEALRCDPETLGRIMADHTQVQQTCPLLCYINECCRRFSCMLQIYATCQLICGMCPAMAARLEAYFANDRHPMPESRGQAQRGVSLGRLRSCWADDSRLQNGALMLLHASLYVLQGWESHATEYATNVSQVFFEKANHWLYIEEPKTFVDVVKRFIDPETRASIVHESCV